ncbi:hypothetical protein Gpo141_00006618 [Globisporangium polare]
MASESDEERPAAQLSEFLDVLASYAPTLPEELVEFHLQQAGFCTSDPRIVRMVALVAHKFLLDVTHDTLQYQRIRSAQSSLSAAAASGSASATSALMAATGGAAGAGTRTVLTMEDLAASLKEYGVNICKPEYVSDVADESAAH